MSVRVPIRLRPASPPSSRMLSRGLSAHGFCGLRLPAGGLRGRVQGRPGGALGVLLALEHRADRAGLIVGVAGGDGHRCGDGEGEDADQDAAGQPLGAGDPAAQAEVAGDHHADPDQRDDDQRDRDPAQHRRVTAYPSRPWRSTSGVDAERQHRGREQAEDDAADDPALGGDQAEPGDRGAGDGEHHRPPEVVGSGSSERRGRCGGAAGRSQLHCSGGGTWSGTYTSSRSFGGGRNSHHSTCAAGFGAIHRAGRPRSRCRRIRLCLGPRAVGTLAQRSAPAGRARWRCRLVRSMAPAC